MRLLENLNHYISLYLETLKQLFKVRIWFVLLLFAGLNWVVLFAHYDFLKPHFFGVISLWLSLFSDNIAIMFTHFPGHLLVLPTVFGWAKLVLGLLFEGLVLGIIALLFRRIWLRKSGLDEATSGKPLRVWPQLLVAWFVINGLFLAISIFLPQLLESQIMGHPRRQMIVEFAILPLLFSILLGLMYFVIPSIIVYKDNVVRAISRSLSIAVKRPFSAFFLALLVLIGPIIVSGIAGRADDIITKFRPELVYWVLSAGLLVDALANFIWMGTSVRFLMDLRDE